MTGILKKKKSPCPYYYYQCKSSNTCPNADNHVSSNSANSGNTSSTPPPPTDDTPNCSDCTSHCSSPCSCTNSGTCNGTVSTPPKPPATVKCSRWDCSASVSSTDEHRVGPCSGCGSSYWSCGCRASYSESYHRTRSCCFSGCSNTWQACSIEGWSPLCNNAYRKRKGWKCGAR